MRQATQHGCLPSLLGERDKGIEIVYGKEKKIFCLCFFRKTSSFGSFPGQIQNNSEGFRAFAFYKPELKKQLVKPINFAYLQYKDSETMRGCKNNKFSKLMEYFVPNCFKNDGKGMALNKEQISKLLKILRLGYWKVQVKCKKY
jgi:hypothetical protein